MIRTMLATSSIAVLGLAGPAAAVTTGPGATPRPATDLVLSYTAEAGYAASVTLTCHPAGGGHPHPARACAVLKKADGDPALITPKQRMCTTEYAPITAEITGTWKGAAVTWSKTFGNPCALARHTGVLFAF
jgi:hypothetical protein